MWQSLPSSTLCCAENYASPWCISTRNAPSAGTERIYCIGNWYTGLWEAIFLRLLRVITVQDITTRLCSAVHYVPGLFQDEALLHVIICTVRYRTEFLSRFAKFYVDISRCTVYLLGNIHTHAEHVTHANGTKFAVNFAIVEVNS